MAPFVGIVGVVVVAAASTGKIGRVGNHSNIATESIIQNCNVKRFRFVRRSELGEFLIVQSEPNLTKSIQTAEKLSGIDDFGNQIIRHGSRG